MSGPAEESIPMPAASPRAEPSRSRRGAEAAFEAAFHQHWARVYGVLVRLTGDAAEAEDLALETFLRLWERPPARADNVAGWLHRVAVNLGYNALRGARRRAGYEARAVGASGAVASGAGPMDPAAAAEGVEVRGHVRRVLGEMPARDAHLLVLRQAGLSYQELAAALGVAPGSIGTLLARAERGFAERMGRGEDQVGREGQVAGGTG